MLILGGASVHCKLVDAAREMGIYTIVTDYLVDSPAKLIADKSYMYDINDVDSIVKMCLKENVNGVIGPYLDPCQRPYYTICHRLGLPCYMDNWEQVIALTDKETFKDYCVKNGIDIIRSYDYEKPEEIEYPVLVKPALSRGSRGQKVCFNYNEVEQAVNAAVNESGNSRTVIEKYMGTSDNFTVSLLFADGEAYVTKTSDIYTGSLENNLENVYAGIVSPSIHTDFYLKKVHKRVVDALKRLGINKGPVFLQGFKDGDTIRFYDPGFRFPGSGYDLNLKKCVGVDMMKVLINLAFTGRIDRSYFDCCPDIVKLNGKTSVTFTPFVRPGKITAIHGLEQIKSLPDMTEISFRHRVGDQIDFFKNVNQIFASFEFVSENRFTAQKNIDFILDTLRVEDESGANMIFDSRIDIIRG